MTSLVLRRLLLAVPILAITSAATFFLQALAPGDAARTIAGIGAAPDAYEQIRRELHLDLPLWEQYGRYVERMLHGDLGASVFSGEAVTHTLAVRTPVTLSLIVCSTLLAAVVGIALGTVSARLGGWSARVLDVLSLTGSAVPNFWLALVLMSAFAITLPLFPATGYLPWAQSPSLWAASLVLPVVALAAGGVAQIVKITRDAVSNALEQDYIRTLRAAGISERALLWKHALKNAAIPVVTVIGLAFVGALVGSLFVENVFDLPGLGSLVTQATLQGDIPVIQGVALTYAVVVIAVNLLVDLSYGVLNPKVRVR